MRAVAVYRAKPVEPALAAADRVSRLASLALALALPGDTVLYLLLPLYASFFGV
ncbi:MAG: MFS transporter, partial [Alphaproteobacteria bacterium]|nr:MFS transporter [Alphaproteobacteria bacterium]